MEEILKDERFSHVFKDPRFKKLPKRVEKIAVDKRFKQMFKDRKFKEKYVMDKRGRPLNMTSSEDLKKLYNISSESSESDNDEEADSEEISEASQPISQEVVKKSQLKKNVKEARRNSDDDTSENEPPQDEKDLLSESSEEDEGIHAERTQVKITSEAPSADDTDSDSSDEVSEDSSDSDTDDSESEQNDDEFDHHWEELNRDAVETNEISRRLAVCNMDWDRIRADDLFTVFDSFKPAGGCVNSVKIYPSEYGLKRIEEEKLRGPLELVEKKLEPEEEDEADTKKGSKYHMEKLRQYQINRLKYFYAVVECDSPETANSLYEQLNGMEYESSSTVFDIRFIPDDLTFNEKPQSEADKAPDLSNYKPRNFVTTALQQVKVNLTWDETDPRRRDVLRKAFTEPTDIERDIHDYLASSSSESDDDNIESTQHEEGDLSRKERMAKYRALLQSLEDKEKDDENDYEMEITWEPGLKEKTEEIVKAKLDKHTLTPFEESLKKKKEQRMKKKGKIVNEESESISSLSDESEDDETPSREMKSHFSKKKVQTLEDRSKLAELALLASDSVKLEDIDEKPTKYRKKKKAFKAQEDEKDEIPDINDPRFSAMYTSPLYSIDPSDSHFKSRKGMAALIEEQQRKRKNASDPPMSGQSANVKRYKMPN